MRLFRITIMTGILITLCTIFWKLVTNQEISLLDILDIFVGMRASVIFGCIVIAVVATLLLLALKLGPQWYKAYRFHRLLLEAELTLQEHFLRLSPGGVDKRRDRMLDIMRAAEECQTKPLILANHDKGSVQKTARGIIEADKSDLSGYRSKRRSARINAFALEAILRGSLMAARSHILQNQLQAVQKGSSLPEILPAFGELLKINVIAPNETSIARALQEKNPVGVFPAAIWSAVKFWRHPKHLTYITPDGEILVGWSALNAMRRV